MINAGLFTSYRSDWTTPKDLFNLLDQEFDFTLDACASDENALCQDYFTEIDEALMRQWTGRVFMNPPYGRHMGMFIEKAFNEVAWGHAELVCCLVASRTDTKWWHDYCMKGEIRFIRGRLKFGGSKTGAPFPSAIVIFKMDEAGKSNH